MLARAAHTETPSPAPSAGDAIARELIEATNLGLAGSQRLTPSRTLVAAVARAVTCPCAEYSFCRMALQVRLEGASEQATRRLLSLADFWRE